MITGANRLFALSIVARLPVAMLSIGLLVHTQQATGSFAAAGLVAGALALAQGVYGPLLGRAVDHCGQTLVLIASALVCAGALAVSAVLPSGAPVAIRVSLAIAAGAALPPVGACLRTLLAMLVEKDARRAAYATDAAASELCWIGGPPIVLGIGAAVSTGSALVAAAVLLAGSTIAFALTKPSRAWRPAPRADDARGAMKAPGVRTLVAVLVAVGCVFGGVEVAVAAAGTGGSAGPLLGLWGIGSLIGGVAAARLGGGARGAGGLAVLLLALGTTHAALALAGSPIVLGALLLLAGATIAPTYATAYAMVDAVAPSGTATEAFAWLATAIAVGTAAGSAGGGAVIDAAGPQVAFVVAGLAGGLAAAITVSRARTLPGVTSTTTGPAEEFRHTSRGTSAAPRATRDAHVAEPRSAIACGPRHPRLHHVSRTDHSSTNPQEAHA